MHLGGNRLKTQRKTLHVLKLSNGWINKKWFRPHNTSSETKTPNSLTQSKPELR